MLGWENTVEFAAVSRSNPYWARRTRGMAAFREVDLDAYSHRAADNPGSLP